MESYILTELENRVEFEVRGSLDSCRSVTLNPSRNMKLDVERDVVRNSK